MRLRNEQPDWKKLIELVGDDGASALSAVYGGGRLYVPRFLGAHHPITQCVGGQGAARVAAEFGGGHVEIPMGLGKRAQVLQLSAAKVPVAEICRRVGYSRRMVYLIREVARDGEEPPQPDLFAKPAS